MTDPREVQGSDPNQMSDQNADEVLIELFEKYRSRGRGYTDSRSRRGRRFRRNSGNPKPAEQEEDAADSQQRWSPSPGMYRSKTGTGPSRYDPRPIGAILDKEVRDRDWQRSLATGTIIGQWEQIVGDVVARHCPVESFEDGRLVVQADSTAWAQQMKLLLPEVMRAIEVVVGHGVVDAVIVRSPRAPSWNHGPRTVPGRGPRDTYG